MQDQEAVRDIEGATMVDSPPGFSTARRWRLQEDFD